MKHLTRWIFAMLLLNQHSFSADPTSVAYVTDVEGNYEKLIDFFKNNGNFVLGNDGQYHLKDGAHFVFGGDVPDRGDGTLRILETLLRMKQEAGKRVTFLCGNRDGNKVRLKNELSEEGLKRDNPDPRFAVWKKELVEKQQDPNSRLNRLKFILEKTMGAPKAFELRRSELSRGKPAPVNDDAVVASFMEEIGPNGLTTQYLEQAKVAHRIGNTLFVHSGIPESALGHVPGIGENIADIDVWISKLNEWYAKEISEWKAGKSNAQELIDYTRPENIVAGSNQKSVIYGKNTDVNNNPFLPSPKVIAALKKAGINRLVIGHSPTDQTPVVLRFENDFEVYCMDNSYSKTESLPHQLTLTGNKLDTARVLFQTNAFSDQIETIDYALKLGEYSLIGKRLSDGSLIVGKKGDRYLGFNFMPGFKAFNRTYSYDLAQFAGIQNAVGPHPINACPDVHKAITNK